MDIYFVRHGQTDGNVAKRHQHPHIELNEIGKVQVERTARLLKSVKATHLITSTNKRAVETARTIGLTIDLIPETHPAFEELKRPDFLIGKRFQDKDTIYYLWGWFFGLKAASMHDGESYTDLLRRLTLARTHLASLPKRGRVVVVSHAVFINFFLAHMNNGERMGLRRAAVCLFNILTIRNASIIHLRYEPDRTPQWRVIERRS